MKILFDKQEWEYLQALLTGLNNYWTDKSEYVFDKLSTLVVLELYERKYKDFHLPKKKKITLKKSEVAALLNILAELEDTDADLSFRYSIQDKLNRISLCI